MSKILELKEKRAKAWEAAKAFLDAKRTEAGFVSAEDAATYDKMEADVVKLGEEIDRLERQAVIDEDELVKPDEMPFGQIVNVISDGNSYQSILTGRERGKNTKLIFGTVRLELTKILRRNG